MGAAGRAGQELRGTVMAGPPEVDVRSGIVILPAGSTYTVLPSIGNQGLPVCVSCPVLYCS